MALKASNMASGPEKPQWDGVERRQLGERRAEILKAAYSHVDELYPLHVRLHLPQFLDVNTRQAALQMSLDIAHRAKTVIFESCQVADFSADAALIFGDLVAQFKEDGILPLVSDEEYPFGRPFEGFDGLSLRIQMMAREISENPSGLSDLIQLEKGAIRLMQIPFPLGAFEKTTALDDVMKAASEDALGFSEKFPASHMSAVKCKVEEFQDESGKNRQFQKWSQVRTFPRCAISMNPNA